MNQIRSLFLFAALLSAVLIPAYPHSSIYYVALNGNDDNLGTLAQPWRTLGKAASALLAGDTLYLRQGTYNERLYPDNSGAPGAYITFSAYPGETVILDGTGIDLGGWGGVIDMSLRSYIRIRGLRVINSTYAGIFAATGQHLVIENNSTYNTISSGIALWSSDDVLVNGNDVELACNGGDQESLTIAGTSNFTVQYNEVHFGPANSNGKEGIDIKDGSHDGVVRGNNIHHMNHVGLYIDAWDKHTYNIDIYNNRSHDNAADGMAVASEQGGLLENVRIYNNLSYHNQYVGLTLFLCCTPAAHHPLHNIQVVNNTFQGNGWDAWGPGLSIENPDIQSMLVRNNLFSGNLYTQIAIDPAVPLDQLTIDHNLSFGDQENPAWIGSDAVLDDPKLVAPAVGDLHLSPDSPAIDAGSATNAPAFDYAGYPRPQDGDLDGAALFDLGAYEYPRWVAWIYLPVIRSRQ